MSAAGTTDGVRDALTKFIENMRERGKINAATRENMLAFTNSKLRRARLDITRRCFKPEIEKISNVHKRLKNLRKLIAATKKQVQFLKAGIKILVERSDLSEETKQQIMGQSWLEDLADRDVPIALRKPPRRCAKY